MKYRIPLLLSATFLLVAQTLPSQQFKNFKANDIISTDKSEEATAKANYLKALEDAKNKEISALEILMVETTKTGDLDEALKYRAKINAIKEEIKALTTTTTTTTTTKPTATPDNEPDKFVGSQWGNFQLQKDGVVIRDGKNWGEKWSVNDGAITIHFSDGRSEIYKKTSTGWIREQLDKYGRLIFSGRITPKMPNE